MKNFLIPALAFILLVIAAGFSFADVSGDIQTRAALGKKLFSEKILSRDSSVSCASCHKPAFAFSDTMAFSAGIEGRYTKRNTPSVLNMKNRPYYFWDGRAGIIGRTGIEADSEPR
ncbi:MAG: cytochrome c peroxidase [Ferruginibacter sp.]